MAELNLTGEFFERFPDVPFHKYLGLTIEEAKPDFARLRLTITDETPTGIGGSVNGGVIASLIDIAVIPAVFAGAPVIWRFKLVTCQIFGSGPTVRLG